MADKRLEQVAGFVRYAQDLLQQMIDEMQEKFDAMSETAQEGERGTALQDEIERLAKAIETLGSADF